MRLKSLDQFYHTTFRCRRSVSMTGANGSSLFLLQFYLYSYAIRILFPCLFSFHIFKQVQILKCQCRYYVGIFRISMLFRSIQPCSHVKTQRIGIRIQQTIIFRSINIHDFTSLDAIYCIRLRLIVRFMMSIMNCSNNMEQRMFLCGMLGSR